MPLGAFYDEIAILIADDVIDRADWLLQKTSDKKVRAHMQKEWARIERSDEWLDTLVHERVLMVRAKK